MLQTDIGLWSLIPLLMVTMVTSVTKDAVFVASVSYERITIFSVFAYLIQDTDSQADASNGQSLVPISIASRQGTDEKVYIVSSLLEWKYFICVSYQ